VRSLTLISSCARCDERNKEIIESWGELPTKVDPPTMCRLLMPWLYTSAFYARPGAVANLTAQLLNTPYPPTVHGMFNQSRAISAFDSSGRLSAIRCPTLVLVGREDILIPVSFSEELARGIPGARLVVLEKTGHGPLVETPAAVAQALLDFLR